MQIRSNYFLWVCFLPLKVVICVLLSFIYAYLLVRGHNIPQIYMCTFMTKYSQENPTSEDILKMIADHLKAKACETG